MRKTLVKVISMTVFAVCAVVWSGHPTQAGIDITGYQAIKWGDTIYNVLQQTDGSLAITLEGKRAISFHRTLAEADFVAVATFDDVQSLSAVVLTTRDGISLSEQQVRSIVQAYHEKYGEDHQQESIGQTKTFAWQFPSGALTMTILEASPAHRKMTITYKRIDQVKINPNDV